MTKLTWEKPGTKTYEVGIDRGVLYLENRIGVPWNGLTGFDDSTDNTNEPQYFDGNKYYENQLAGDTKGTLSAVTFPDEFLKFDGFVAIESGLLADNQPSEAFHLSYRTMIGNDTDGLGHAYQIHILYNLVAESSERSNNTLADAVSPMEFTWDITSSPEEISGWKPTAHVIIDSRYIRPDLLEFVEDLLYGTVSSNPTLPPLNVLATSLMGYDRLVITDNGDGTWTATGPDHYFNMISSTEFEIIGADTSYINPTTYFITSDAID